MKTTEKIFKIANERGIIQAKDLEEIGITRNHLYELCKKGKLQRISRGMYMLPDAEINEYQPLIEITKKIPSAVICLISALYFHELTTQLPNEIWIAVPVNTWRPKFEYPKLNYTVLNEKTYRFGIQAFNLHGTNVKVYSPAKTVADCFKFRNKVGLDVAIEALREAWLNRKITIDEIAEAAKVNRVFKIMKPYLEAIV